MIIIIFYNETIGGDGAECRRRLLLLLSSGNRPAGLNRTKENIEILVRARPIWDGAVVAAYWISRARRPQIGTIDKFHVDFRIDAGSNVHAGENYCRPTRREERAFVIGLCVRACVVPIDCPIRTLIGSSITVDVLRNPVSRRDTDENGRKTTTVTLSRAKSIHVLSVRERSNSSRRCRLVGRGVRRTHVLTVRMCDTTLSWHLAGEPCFFDLIYGRFENCVSVAPSPLLRDGDGRTGRVDGGERMGSVTTRGGFRRIPVDRRTAGIRRLRRPGTASPWHAEIFTIIYYVIL